MSEIKPVSIAATATNKAVLEPIAESKAADEDALDGPLIELCKYQTPPHLFLAHQINKLHETDRDQFNLLKAICSTTLNQ